MSGTHPADQDFSPRDTHGTAGMRTREEPRKERERAAAHRRVGATADVSETHGGNPDLKDGASVDSGAGPPRPGQARLPRPRGGAGGGGPRAPGAAQNRRPGGASSRRCRQPAERSSLGLPSTSNLRLIKVP